MKKSIVRQDDSIRHNFLWYSRMQGQQWIWILSLPSRFLNSLIENSTSVNTRFDWNEIPETLFKEEVKVEIEDDRVLQVSRERERNVEKEDKNDIWHRIKCSSGKFLRRIRLPENAKMHHVKASIEN
ncbi:hypothetical protein H0E87_021989 [Populus deltoides]|uniref:SHSP domain-containing protein n=1 Tax=Populus deltoides TaxID=3696 RepID=A0A8T2XKN8_POPDE|nr:hypothetical protein H0E87_021989 [Populus deltoides]